MFLRKTVRHGLQMAALVACAATLPAQLGMIADDTTDRVYVFNSSTNAVIGSVAIPGGSPFFGDCAVTRDQRLGFVTTFRGLVYVIDLTTVPPTLASGINPIRISNPGEDIDFTIDGKFMVICDGLNIAPISVVDIASRVEVSTFSNGGACTSVTVCDNGDLLATSTTTNTTRRLTISSSGVITATLNSLPTATPINSACAPGSRFGVVMPFLAGTIVSFRTSNMSLRQTRTLSTNGQAAAFSPDGTVVYVRGIRSVDAFGFDPTTGAFSAAPLWSKVLPAIPSYLGIESVAVHPDGNKVYVAAGAVVNVYSPGGTLLTTITSPGMTATTGICIADCPTAARTLRVPQKYPTIHAALCLACPGDTILVKNGVHDGFEVAIPNVCILGRSYPRIHGQVRIRAHDVKIQGLHVYPGSRFPIGILNQFFDRCTIKSNVVFGERLRNVREGIWLEDSKNSSVTDNVVLDCPTSGIGLWGDVSGSQVRGNRLNTNGGLAGIFCWATSFGATIRGNTSIGRAPTVAGTLSGHDVKNNKKIPGL